MTQSIKYASVAAACVLPLALALTFGKSIAASPAPTMPATVANVPSTVTLPAGTRVDVRLEQTVSSRTAPGTEFAATIAAPVIVDGRTIIPSGAPATGRVIDSKQSGRLKGVARLSLALNTVRVDGTSYELHTTAFGRTGRNHKRRNWTLIGGGAGTGMLIGGLAGGPVGLAIGAGAGSGAGAIASAVTGKKEIVLPVETRVGFALRQPTEIQVAIK